MKSFLLAAALTTASPAWAAPPPETDIAWDIVSGLATEIGPRLAGTDAEARAREWAKAKLEGLGFANVAIESFTFRGWIRCEERAALTAPYKQPLVITALGYSEPTPVRGLEGELVYFPTLDALRTAPEGSLKGRIAFIDHAMKANQDGSGYGPYGNVRRQGPSIAAEKGAKAVVIRSIGTDSHRNPHAGATTFADGVAPIPSGAVSNPDADLIARVARSGKTMRIAMTLTGYTRDELPSGNVVADLPGSDPSLPAILVGCHLDSWDLGTGAIDDAAGCAIVTAAALKAHAGGGKPRTIRVLWAGSEELGGFGGSAYAEKHADEPHALVMESDFGADRVWNVQFRLGPDSKALQDRLASALAPMGIVYDKGDPFPGTDVKPIADRQKLAVIRLGQDGTRYFDLHHTPDDTLDKVDPAQLAQNVEAWTRVLSILAEETGPITSE